jgi:hypothetical protein
MPDAEEGAVVRSDRRRRRCGWCRSLGLLELLLERLNPRFVAFRQLPVCRESPRACIPRCGADLTKASAAAGQRRCAGQQTNLDTIELL